jgi:hypothetical protein
MRNRTSAYAIWLIGIDSIFSGGTFETNQHTRELEIKYTTLYSDI